MKKLYNEEEIYYRAKKRVEELKGFYSNLISYILVIPFLIFINLMTSPGFHWFWFPMFGWGLGVTIHGLKTFGYKLGFGKEWEERKIKEFMEKDN